MTGRPPKITGALREELWRRYKAGDTILGTGRVLNQRRTTIRRILQATGGIAPAPSVSYRFHVAGNAVNAMRTGEHFGQGPRSARR